jgi:hypothetical protein
MILSIPICYLHPPVMVPQPSLPPQTKGIMMQILVQDPGTPLSPPTVGTSGIIGGRRNNKYPTSPLPPRVQPPCALCERDMHPTNRCPTLPMLRNLIQLPRATTSLTTPPSMSNTTMESSTVGNKGL